MKLCFIASAESIHTLRWIGFFARSGHEVHLISVKPKAPVEIPGVHTHWISTRGPRALRHVSGFSQLARYVYSIRPEVLHAHYLTDYGSAAACIFGYPVMMTAWGSDVLIDPASSMLNRFKVRWALMRANLITCDAEHLVQAMTALGARREKIHVIFFGTDVEKFCPGRRDAALRNELGFDDDALVVISTRSHRPIYSVETFVDAIPQVLARNSKTRFIIAGDGPERVNLESQAGRLGVSHAVRFVGQQSEDNLARLYASSDVYVSTSLSDGGIAASTAEAMACGLPVVMTDFGDNRSWIEIGRSGALAEAKSSEAFAKGIFYFLEDPSRREDAGKINRKKVEEENNLYRQMSLVEAFYRRLSASSA